MVKFDRTIAPGQVGRVTLSVRVSLQWAGRRFSKRAIVLTNDAKMKRFTLILSGFVKGKPPRPVIDRPALRPNAAGPAKK